MTRSIRATVVALAIVFAAVTPATTSRAATTPSTGGELVFNTEEPNRQVINRVQADGTGFVRLTPPGESDSSPDWSPSAARIAFTCTTPNAGANLWVMNADGSGRTRLTSGPTGDFSPDWSPDGRRIVFSRYANGDSHLAILDIATGVVTLVPTQSVSVGQPVWSPDGSRIAFWSGSAIHVIDASGANERVLTGSTGNMAPAWSPDGTTIVWAHLIGSRYEIWSMRADGSDQHVLVSSSASLNEPAFSSDGTAIAFGSGTGLYRVDADGSNLQPILETGYVHGADWRPPPPADRVDIRVTGAKTYAVNGPTGGNFSIVKAANGNIASVRGSGTVPSPAGSGMATISIDVSALFGFLPIGLGNIRISDPAAGITLDTPVIFGSVLSAGATAATGTAGWFLFTPPLSLQGYQVAWRVTDNV